MELITENVGMLFVLVCDGGLWEFEKIAGAGRGGNVGNPECRGSAIWAWVKDVMIP